MEDALGAPPPLSMGKSSGLQVGQFVLAIGNPFGFDQTLTTGVISALKRRVVVDGTHEIPDAIQTDAAINPGNSGGPLLSSAGEMIGINTSIVSATGTSSGIGFAIPVQTVKRVVPELIQTGHAGFPGIGVIIAPHAVSIANKIAGLAIEKVLADSPADHAQLRGREGNYPGDVITEANGVPTKILADLTEQIVRTGIGEPIRLTLRQRGISRVATLRVIDETTLH